MANAPHHASPAYRRMAAHVRAVAYLNASTTCWRCGLTLDAVRLKHPRATWHAGHLIDGDLSGGLRAECSPCNTSAGATYGNARREPHSPW